MGCETLEELGSTLTIVHRKHGPACKYRFSKGCRSRLAYTTEFSLVCKDCRNAPFRCQRFERHGQQGACMKR